MNRVFENQRNRLIAGSAALVLIAGFGGAWISGGLAPTSSDTGMAEEEGEHHGNELIPMTPERLEASGVRVEKVQSGLLATDVIAQATVAAPPEGRALISAPGDGRVARILKRLGDPVGRGETVVLLESREASAIAAERNAAAAAAQAARANAAREQRLFDAKISSRQELEAAIAAQKMAEAELGRASAAMRAAGVTGDGRYLAVRSPISGRITATDTQLGAYVEAGAELFDVADPRSVQIEASVPGGDADRIRPGDLAFIEVSRGETLEARVRSVTPSLDRESRTATVVLQPSGATAGLIQGRSLRVRIVPHGNQPERLILPEEAVQQIDGRDMVFVEVDGGFRPIPVTIGVRSDGRIEIVEGLEPGQSVATEGAFVLKSQLGASEAEH